MAQVHQPRRSESRRADLASYSTLQHLGEWAWRFEEHSAAGSGGMDMGELAPRVRKQASCPSFLLMAALGVLAKAVLENSPWWCG